ncbi:sigma-70 family RNA polymerase sigma factor [Methylomonas sp. OY6]|uniref:Sigma-70 family RNA polymerase sigma factor n=1 Tax=Methylomonas defluvii TaxID=3045149 RepID=A0ABU4UH82_9GAMM|nr:sigma-70 family RNA polymerase sigma factor [Methylomonas sp. OY6]MDX8128796.1 sigma-70 family RNA polymerase sigma factor [Methylomonas sp. OY6]
MADSDLNDDENRQPITPADEALLLEWLGRVVDQDQAALGKLYDTLVDQVYGLALRITRRAQCAEEVVQDTFWQIWRQAPRFDAERGSVKAWVMTMARSRALDALRQLDGNLNELEPEALALIEAPTDQMPPDLLSAVQQGHRLQTALAALEPLPRQLLSLAFFRGLSHDEIAVCSGLPLGTVKSHIRRALQTMQQLLTADAGEVN